MVERTDIAQRGILPGGWKQENFSLFYAVLWSRDCMQNFPGVFLAPLVTTFATQMLRVCLGQSEF